MNDLIRPALYQAEMAVIPSTLPDSVTINELPSWDIQEIKSRVSILDLLPNAVPSSRDGRWYVVLCPFHDDQNPSFWIDTERGICECRTCNIKTMDVINLYARLNNLTNDEAIKSLGNGS